MNTEENKWLTIIEAAKKLNISEVDIYTAALNGHLRLSYNFVNGATVRSTTVMSIDEAEVTCRPFEYICGPFWGKAYWRDGDWLKVEDFLLPVTGVLDIPMLGGALLDVKRNRQRLGGGSELTLLCPAGILLENSDGELLQLQEFSTITGTYRIAPCLPDSRDFVVRCDALNDWEKPGAKTQTAPAIEAEMQNLAGPSDADDGAVVASTTTTANGMHVSLAGVPVSPAVVPVAPQPPAEGKTTRHKLRANSLDVPIEKAIKRAESIMTGAVYLELRELAINGEKPFTGALDGDSLCYTKDDNITLGKLTKDALGKRLKNRRQ